MKKLLLSILLLTPLVNYVSAQVKSPANALWNGETTFFYSNQDQDGEAYTIDTLGIRSTGNFAVIKSSPTLPFFGTRFIAYNLRSIVEKHAGSLFSVPEGKALSVEQALAIGFSVDTFTVTDPITGEKIIKVVSSDLLSSTAGFFIKQRWEIDASGHINSCVKSIIPVLLLDEKDGYPYTTNEARWQKDRLRPLFEIRFDNSFAKEFPFNAPSVIHMELRNSKVSFNSAIKNPKRDSSAFVSLFPGTASNRFASYDPLSILCDKCLDKFPDASLLSQNPFKYQSFDTVFVGEQMKVIQHDYCRPFLEWKFNVVQAFFIDEKTLSLNSMVLGIGPAHEFIDPEEGKLIGYKTDYFIRQVKTGISK